MIKFNKKIVLIILLMFLILLIPKNVQAVGLQANKGGESLTNTTFQVFFDSIRQMEDEHGTLGTTNDTEEKKNGIDCHMAKNTEWGTAAMLSASRYGVVQQGEDTESEFHTTTGNKSGVYQMASNINEFVATTGHIVNSVYTQAKYKNDYPYDGNGRYYQIISYFSGDGMYSWFGATANNHSPENSNHSLIRGSSAKLFNCDRMININTLNSEKDNTSSRAAVVCGSGL